jgi:hypothetical protein
MGRGGLIVADRQDSYEGLRRGLARARVGEREPLADLLRAAEVALTELTARPTDAGGLRLTLAFPPEHTARLVDDARWLEVSPEKARELAGRGWRVVEVAAVSEHEAALGDLERACEALRLISYGEVPDVEFADDDDLVAAYAQEVLASLDAGEPGEPSLAAQARIATEEMCGEPDPNSKSVPNPSKGLESGGDQETAGGDGPVAANPTEAERVEGSNQPRQADAPPPADTERRGDGLFRVFRAPEGERPERVEHDNGCEFKLWFGSESWPGVGWAVPTGMPGEVNLIVPIEGKTPPLCQPPWPGIREPHVAVIVHREALLAALGAPVPDREGLDDKSAGRGAAAAVPSEGSGDGGVGAGTDAPRPADDEPWAAWERITSVPFAADRAAELAGDIGAVVVRLDRLRGRAAVLACDLRTIERSTDEQP